MKYVDLDVIDTVRVTFEADNNLDFRLGTSRLKNTRIADEGDMVLSHARGSILTR